MKNLSSKILVLIAMIWGCVFVLNTLSPVSHNTDISTTVSIDTVYIRDTLIINSKPKKPTVIETPEKPEYDTTKCDSLYNDLFSKHYSKLLFSNVVYSDSNVVIQLDEVVQGNNIIDRKLRLEKNFPVVTKTVTITETKYPRGIYIMGTFGYKEITPSMLYVMPKYTILAGYNIATNTPVVGVGINLNKIIKW